MTHSSDQSFRSVRVEASPIDRFFLAAASSVVLWLIFGGFIQCGAFIKFAWPSVSESRFFQFPRLMAVSDILELYGALGGFIFAASGWMLSRSARQSSNSLGLMWGGLFAWNVGLFVGVAGCFLSGPGVFFQDHLSLCSKVLIYLGWILSGFWLVPRIASSGFGDGLEFIFSGFLWFSLLFLSSAVILRDPAVLGVPEAFLSQWFTGSVRDFVSPCLGLGLMFYIVFLYSRDPSFFGVLGNRCLFWFFAILGPFVGLARLSSGPVPLWIGGVGSAIGMLSAIPSVGLSLVLLRLLASFGSGCGVFYAKFLRASVGFFLVSQLLSAFVSVRSIDTVARYTLFDVGASRLVTQGFGVFCVLGAIGLISCKVLRGYSEFSFLKNLSFLACTYGVGAGVLLLAVAGFLAGGDINAVDVPFAQVVDSYGFFSTGLVCCAALHFVGLCLFGLDLVVGFVRSRF